jgi:hypothetical protein
MLTTRPPKTLLEGGRLSAIRTGRLYPREYSGNHFYRLSRLWAHGIAGCHGKKSPVTPPVIGLVAQCLNHSTGDQTSSAVP